MHCSAVECDEKAAKRVIAAMLLAFLAALPNLAPAQIAHELVLEGTFWGPQKATTPIRIELTVSGTTASGRYLDTSTGATGKLDGQVTPNQLLHLLELERGNVYSRLNIRLDGETATGDWKVVGVDEPYQLKLKRLVLKAPVADTVAPSVEMQAPGAAPLIAIAPATVSTERPATAEVSAISLPPIAGSAETVQVRVVARDPGNLEASQPPASRPGAVDPSNSVSQVDVALAGVFLVIIIGVILGLAGRITVFRNYTDLFLVFVTGLGMIGTFFVAGGAREQLPVLALAVGGVTLCLAFYVIGRTYVDNPNPIYFVIALTTKLALSVLFLVNLIGFIAPKGRTGSDRAANRRNSLIFLLLVAPLVVRLVRDREGLLNPSALLGRRF